MTRLFFLFGLCTLIACLTAGCNSQKTANKGQDDNSNKVESSSGLENKLWQLETIAVGPTPEEVPDSIDIHARFVGGQVEGHGGCNGFGASYSLDGSQLTVTDIIHTEMYCEGKSEWEQSFWESLGHSLSYEVQGKMLEINCGDMGSLIFEQARKNDKK